MKDAAPQGAATPVLLSDYAPYPYDLREVTLTFRLHPSATRVTSRIVFDPRPGADGTLRLDGRNLTLVAASVDGVTVTPQVTVDGLTCPVPGAPFVWECEVEIDPRGNTALEGLYLSGGMFCTQCEAEGFRKITYYPDRPDVMAPFTVTIDSDAPVLLSNGNPIPAGDGASGAPTWHDPHPKPAYLFALVAGDLVAQSQRFTTMSGRDVALNIWVRPGDEGKCAYAMDALIRSMRWDEEVYGREYDLDVFNIVAVDDFNMGAMENKGLNVFNSRYVLASPETATDRDYELIEGIVAHEYFHNWTGNRITCRDWFQLCLKEGLTVFRDQQFTADMRGAAVKRIEDAMQLRARQFREDAGPLAHPVRPESYLEINNFYTATVYDKGAEVIGMLRRLVGAEAYAAALDLYFDRHDGDAATIEDWIAVFRDATGRDLSQFALWYSQAGTPHLTGEGAVMGGHYLLTLGQRTAPTPGQPDKAPMVIPVAVGLLSAAGDEVVPTRVLELTQASQTFDLGPVDVAAGTPVLSLLRGFSAPVVIDRDVPRAERLVLLAHDTDPFNRWEAGRTLARETLARMAADDAVPDAAHLDALATLTGDASLDPAFRALALALPSEDDTARGLSDGGITPDPAAIHAAHEALAQAMAERLEPVLATIYDSHAVPGPYSPDAESAGRRALRNAALGLLTRRDGGDRARAQLAAADNMTDELAALSSLLRIGRGADALADFGARWSGDRLVVDKWFALQATHAAPDEVAATLRRLVADPAFDAGNPNRFRSVWGALGANHAGFHHAGGAVYDMLADAIVDMDARNPMTAARLTVLFDGWTRYDADRSAGMRAALGRIAGAPGLSRDTSEMTARLLAAGPPD